MLCRAFPTNRINEIIGGSPIINRHFYNGHLSFLDKAKYNKEPLATFAVALSPTSSIDGRFSRPIGRITNISVDTRNKSQNRIGDSKTTIIQ